MKNKISYLIVAFIALFYLQSAQAQVMYEWSRSYDGGSIDGALLVSPEGSNFIHIAGTTQVGTDNKLIIRKYRTNGNLQWSRISPSSIPGTIRWIKRDASFNTYMICYSISGYTLLKFGADAHLKWTKTIAESPAGLEVKGNRVYTGGQATTGFFVRCYRTSDGGTVWTRTEGNGYNGRAFTIDNAGNTYVGGSAEGPSYQEQMYIVKFNASSPSPVLSIRYAGPDNYPWNSSQILRIDAGGNIYSCGEVDAFGSGGQNQTVVKFNPAGTFQWKQYIVTTGGAEWGGVDDFIFDAFQNPVLIGDKSYHDDIHEAQRMFVTKLNRSTGVKLFYVYPNDPTLSNPELYEYSNNCTTDSYGNIYFGGYGNYGAGPGVYRWAITKVDGMTGDLRWIEAGSSFTGANFVNSIYVSAGGNVYCGISEASATVDMVLEKFSQPGGGLRLRAENNSFPPAIAYPNPSTDEFTLRFESDQVITDAVLIDLSGRVIAQYAQISGDFKFGKNLAPGIYYLNLSSNSGRQTIRLVKTDR